MNAPIAAAAHIEVPRATLSPRTRLLLEGRIVPTLLRMAWPNILVMLRKVLFVDILRVGAIGSINTLMTTLVGAAGGPNAVAGYGTGARLEYLLIPLVFGLGAPLVALVGTNIGAGWLVLRLTGSVDWLFAALTLALVLYGVIVTAAIASGAWFRRDRKR